MKLMRTFAALAAAALVWLAVLPHLYHPSPGPMAAALARRQLALWSDPVERARLRASNPEWDFMGRAFTAWSMANLARAEPARRAEYLRSIDAIIAATLDDEAQ